MGALYLHLHKYIIQIHDEGMTVVAEAPGKILDDGKLVEILTPSLHTANSSSIVFAQTDCLFPVLVEILNSQQ